MRIYPRQSINTYRVPAWEASDNRDGDQPAPIRSKNHSEIERSAYDHTTTASADEVDWQAVAQRQQAEMDNFRKRQMRRGDEAMALERERLLTLVLPVADNLARALAHADQNDRVLQEGIELTYRELMRLLEAEGVTRLETVGWPFNPKWHEAVATQPTEAESNTVIKELEAGYALGEKLLRPARVIVAA